MCVVGVTEKKSKFPTNEMTIFHIACFNNLNLMSLLNLSAKDVFSKAAIKKHIFHYLGPNLWRLSSKIAVTLFQYKNSSISAFVGV